MGTTDETIYPPETITGAPPTRPSVDDVAALLRARTKDDNGEELGSFTDATRPTDLEVAVLIQLAEGDVIVQVGSDLQPVYAAEAGSMIALRAACFVELSYWPEQVRADRSAYAEYWRMYEAGMAALLGAIAAGGEAGGTVDAFPYGSIPTPSWTLSSRQDLLDLYGEEAPVVNPLKERA
jgi:hypothetical protein